MKRKSKKHKRYVYFGGIYIDTKTKESVSPTGKRKRLTAKEKKLLK